MTDLTSEQKAQVAELLGWERCGNHKEQHWRQGAKEPWERVWRTIDQVVTLEALLAYCRERGWAHSFTYWRESQKYAAEIWATDDDDDPFAESIGDTDHTDPLTALVRAVLAAAEQEKGE